MKSHSFPGSSNTAAQYLGQPIPDAIKQQLASYFDVEALSDIQGSRLAEICIDINKKLEALYAENKKLYGFLKDGAGKEIISLRSLRSYFSAKPGNIKRKKLYALLLFLDAEHGELNQIVDEALLNKEKEYTYADLLNGPCCAYVFDSTDSIKGNVKCIPFWMSKREKDIKGQEFFDIKFKNPWKKNDFDGKARIIHENSIVFELAKNDMILTILAELPPVRTILKDGVWLLNGFGIANGQNGRPVKASMILIKNLHAKNTNIDSYMAREIIPCSYINIYSPHLHAPSKDQNNGSEALPPSSPTPQPDDGLSEEQRNQVISYLSREDNRDKALKAFFPNAFGELTNRNLYNNRKKSRNEYERIKARLHKDEPGYGFFSFNRYRRNREVAIFSYSFEFYDELFICKAARHRISQSHQEEFTGEVTLENENLVFQMQDVEGRRRKQVIAPFAFENGQQHIIKAISSSVSILNYRVMGLREIIVYMKEEELKLDNKEIADGYISYERFYGLNNDIISIATKLYLADRNNCVLTYPEESNSKHVYSRQAKACRYAGLYFLFCQGQHTHADFLLKIILEIDPLAQATIRVKYTSGAYRTYTGECEAYNVNLKIQGFLAAEHSSDQRNIVLIFDHIKEGYSLPDTYTGIILATDDKEGAAVGYSFLCIKINESLKKDKDLKDIVNEDPEQVPVSIFEKLYKKIDATASINSKNFFWKVLNNDPAKNTVP